MAKHRRDNSNEPTEMLPVEGVISDEEFENPSPYVQHVGKVTKVNDKDSE